MSVVNAQVDTAIRELYDKYRSARESLFMQGRDDAASIAQLDRQYREARIEIERWFATGRYEDALHQNTVGGGFWHGLANNSITGSMNAVMQQASMAVEPLRAEEGVLMFRGAPLPEKWLGAHYGGFVRTAIGGQWKISYSSEYTSHIITLFLDTDKYSGLDADKVAQAYLETINQRRLG